ncbi:MAG: ABC transporter ATP-binding protein/permease, partial [Betaproteobacteria bacterium]|nr:ABC transporter ATP-binding protein/permease [Betaproteobacteria bacterium]
MSGARRKGVILLCSVVGFTLALVWVEVQFNDWNKGFYDTFEHKDRLGFYLELGRFAFLAVLFIVLAVYKQYLQQMLMIEWRAWLTDTYLQDWLDGQAYYRLQLLDRGTDNPDQRIADDLNGFVDLTLSLSLGLLSAIVTLVSFVGILWVISGPLEVGGVTIPGYMVWVALLYAIAGTWLTHLIGQPLIGMNFARQRVEADFRFALVRLRENSEGVALYRGEAGELAGFKARFADVIAKWWAIMEKQKQITWFTAFYAQLAIIFPFVVSAPRYFSGAAPLGSIFQTASAFGQVQGALSWFIGAYPSFANWRATVERLTGFTQALARARAEADRLDGDRLEGEDAGLTLEHLVISLPQGRPLLGDTSLRLAPGESVFVTGPSGSGKSTLFRSIAGIWPYWQGRILLPKGARLLFLPQKAYLPIGTL